MYEELVKRLRSHNGWALNKTLDEAADAIEDLQEKLDDARMDASEWAESLEYMSAAKVELEEQTRWISVTERLPEESWERVLAYTDDGTVMTLPAIKLRNGYARYWMSLPEPPKEET